MRKMIRIAIAPIVAAAVFMFSACEDKTNQSYSGLTIKLIDAPANYEEVNLDVKGVEVHASNSADSTNGWTTLNVASGVYNVLDLTNGVDALLASARIPSGEISQIRLILGNGNTVKVDGETLPITVPSSLKSGLKLNVHEVLLPEIDYTIVLDFDAARSIVQDGKGGYKLKPVIRTISTAISGAIKGSITPIESHPAIYALSGADTLASCFPDESGSFLLKGVATGTYTISIAPKEPFVTKSIANIAVTNGAVTDLGAITITE
jgi:hypothetical protein